MNSLNINNKITSYIPGLFDFFFGMLTIGILFACLLFAENQIINNPFGFALLSLNGAMSIYGMAASIRRNASIHFVSFLFCYLFLSLAPICQIGAEIDPIFENGPILFKSILVTFIFVAIGTFYVARLEEKTDLIDRLEKEDKEAIHRNYITLFGVTLFISLLSLTIFGKGLFTSREGFSNLMDTLFSDQATALIAINLLKLTPFFGAVIGLRSALYQKKKNMIFLFGFLLVLALIINNPLTSPRYYLAGIAFFFVDYMMRGQKTRILAIFLIMGIIAAPLFHVFRREAVSIQTPDDQKTLMEETLLSMDYDAFQLNSYTILTVMNDGVTWGTNIAGSIMFFIPRKIWEDKPPATSHIIYETMIEHRTVGTKNLSTPLMAEGYFAFSWFGAIGISFIYWYIITFITRKAFLDSRGISFLIRCVMVGLALIFLRGTLMVGMSAIFGFATAALIPWFIFYKAFAPIRKSGKPLIPALRPIAGKASDK